MKILDQNPQRIKASNYAGTTGQDRNLTGKHPEASHDNFGSLRLIQISSSLHGLIAERLLSVCCWVFWLWFLRFPCAHIRANAIKHFFLNYKTLIGKTRTLLQQLLILRKKLSSEINYKFRMGLVRLEIRSKDIISAIPHPG